MKNVLILEANLTRFNSGEKNGKSWASLNLKSEFKKPSGFDATFYLNGLAFGDEAAKIIASGVKEGDVVVVEGYLYSEKKKDKEKKVVLNPYGKAMYDLKMYVEKLEIQGRSATVAPTAQVSKAGTVGRVF